jgi:hypothetical protein
MISENPLIQALDRMVGPIPDPDPVQVQGELHAFLIRRGQQVAQDLGMAIDLFTPEELAELGRLDVLGTMPDVPQDLALHLAMLQAQAQDQTRQAVASWHEQRERHRGHQHAANETCTVPAWTRPRRRPRSPSDRRLRNPTLGFRPVRTMARVTTLGAVRTENALTEMTRMTENGSGTGTS